MGYIVHGNKATDRVVEKDCVACQHCQAVIVIDKYVKRGGWCGRCNGAVCFVCAKRMDTMGCEPFMQLLEQAMARQERDLAWQRLGVG